MKTIEYIEPISDNTSFPEYYRQLFPDARLLFFDIETTGFIAKNTTLYLIGVLWYEKDGIHILQWFNEDGYSEKEILSSFSAFCKNFTHLVHFNGLGFDLPYLKQKSELLQLPFDVDTHLAQIDIFKEIRSYKKIFLLDNMKQVSIEQFLGILRKDTYSGGDLIHVYQRYVARPEKELENLLLLHNHDDLLGMPSISTILNYKAFFEQIHISDLEASITDNHLLLSFTFDASARLPKRISLTCNGIYLNAFEQKASLSIPILQDTLQHYFKDYKNYYYLPAEDMAVHKSIAAYVDAQNKEKATKNTCYVKKTDAFIPCYQAEEYDSFKFCATDKQGYQTLTSIQSADYSKQNEYIQNTLLAIRKNYS